MVAALFLAVNVWQAANDTSPPLQRALDLFDAGHYRECLDVVVPYARDHPQSSEAHKILGMDKYMLGDTPGALAEVKSATQLNPADSDAFYYLGRLYFSADNPLDALAAFQSAVELDPSSVRAHNQLGQTYQALNRWAEAEKAYLEAIAFEKKQPKKSEWPYYNLGLLCLDTGRKEEAASYLREALVRNPKFAEAQIKLAVVLDRQGATDESLELLQSAIREQPHNAEAHYRFGQLLSRLGKKQEAEREFALFQKYRSRHPGQ